MRFWLYIACTFLVSAVLSDHVPEHDSPIDVNYETVTRIIEALKTPKPDSVQEPTQEVLETTEAEPSQDPEVPEEKIFQKRKQYVAYFHRKPLPGVEAEQVAEDYTIPEQPCEDDDFEGHVEIIEEEEHPGHVGSIRGTPGIDYPNYTEIPHTSFSCADKHVPGFYADVETDCQVFHVCYPHRRESFLCPTGTIFNQPILACDYWYSSNCSAASGYFDVQEEELEPEVVEEIIEDLVSEVEVEPTEPAFEYSTEAPETFTIVIDPSEHTFGPDIPEPLDPKPVPLQVHEVKPIHPTFPVPEIEEPVKIQTPDVVAMAKFLPVKAKVKVFSAPLKAAAIKTKVVAKPKVVKIAAAKLAAKGKIAAVKAVPVAKVVKAAAAKAVLGKAILGKAKLAAPIVKTVAAKKAVKALKFKAAKASFKTHPAISVGTKKQLALSLIRMMKMQKLRNLGYATGPRYYMY